MQASTRITVVTDCQEIQHRAGAGGNLGTQLTKQLLEAGYTVHATVRDKHNVPYLESLGEALPGTLQLFEADFTEPGSYDEATKDATYVFHAATVVDFGTGNAERDQQVVVDATVAGTVNVMESAAKSQKLERIVLTSSAFAVTQDFSEEQVLTEKDWNVRGTAAAPLHLSKVEGEKAAWKLAEKLNLDLVAILPPMIVGPAVSRRPSSSSFSVKALLEGGSFEQVFYMPTHADVRDVARAHILAATVPAAKGRYLVTHEYTTNPMDVANWLRSEFPSYPIVNPPPGKSKRIFDATKAVQELGLKLIPLEKTFKDQARSLIALGLVQQAVK